MICFVAALIQVQDLSDVNELNILPSNFQIGTQNASDFRAEVEPVGAGLSNLPASMISPLTFARLPTSKRFQR